MKWFIRWIKSKFNRKRPPVTPMDELQQFNKEARRIIMMGYDKLPDDLKVFIVTDELRNMLEIPPPLREHDVDGTTYYCEACGNQYIVKRLTEDLGYFVKAGTEEKFSIRMDTCECGNPLILMD